VDDAVQWAIPAGGTPTGESLQVANAYFMANRDPVRKAYVLLGTDGVPTCPNTGGTIPGDLNDPNLAIDAALAIQAVGDLAAAGVPTYVIGIGAELNESNPGVLNQMAQSGGTARSGERKYYAADNVEELGQAMSAIGGEIVSCTFALDETPQGAPDERADNLYVRFNGEEVARDPTHHDGWDYDAESNTITFYGAACERIQSGTVYEIKVLYGCGGVE
jgi:hypothetical protein